MVTIPTKDQDFHIAQETITRISYEKRVEFGLDEQWLINRLFPKKSAWVNAWAAYQQNPADRTPLITFEKTEKRESYEEDLRVLIRGLQSNPKVTPDDLREMGIAIPSSERTPVPVPDTYPEAKVDTSVIRHLTIDFKDAKSSKSKAKPHGVHGAEIRYGICETPPTEVTDLKESAFDTRTPFTLEFAESQRGKTVWFCLRWENTRGQKGPWGELIYAVIP
jgi:hypothetical protein